MHVGGWGREVCSDFVSCFIKICIAIDLQISNLPRTKVTVKLQNHVTSKLYGFSGWTMGADINSSVVLKTQLLVFFLSS